MGEQLPTPQADKTPGEVPPGRRRLARPPSERYARREASAPARQAGSTARAVGFGVVPAVIGAALFTGLAGPLAVDTGLVVMSGLMGLAIGRAVVLGGGSQVQGRQRIAIAAVMFVLALAGAEAATWQFALSEGGVLGLVDYLLDAFGGLLILELLAGLLGAVIAAG